ncbi:hypothetical protein AVV36_gp075 [Pectobacterium bacteriophage PM2]|uniref:Uncharacterized protein n=1 Tax=Pectobacterium bacteriophage PM2 TaxID=1429794 RepID=A0A0A0Q3D5_9CAUD|nr:hypothetical protein AVV36_gp075 [Pectobacterium bacteriophage PM2]AHY25037.1 hypothetical protein PM2_075 [Pectobacterium bacteriophage PM2]
MILVTKEKITKLKVIVSCEKDPAVIGINISDNKQVEFLCNPGRTICRLQGDLKDSFRIKNAVVSLVPDINESELGQIANKILELK